MTHEDSPEGSEQPSLNIDHKTEIENQGQCHPHDPTEDSEWRVAHISLQVTVTCDCGNTFKVGVRNSWVTCDYRQGGCGNQWRLDVT